MRRAGAGGQQDGGKHGRGGGAHLRGDDGRPEPQQLGGRRGRLPAAPAAPLIDPHPGLRASGRAAAGCARGLRGQERPQGGAPDGATATATAGRQWGDYDVEGLRRGRRRGQGDPRPHPQLYDQHQHLHLQVLNECYNY